MKQFLFSWQTLDTMVFSLVLIHSTTIHIHIFCLSQISSTKILYHKTWSAQDLDYLNCPHHRRCLLQHISVFTEMYKNQSFLVHLPASRASSPDSDISLKLDNMVFSLVLTRSTTIHIYIYIYLLSSPDIQHQNPIPQDLVCTRSWLP